jgi:hypothetical protein
MADLLAAAEKGYFGQNLSLLRVFFGSECG